MANFEQQLAELEKVVARLEDGNLPLEEGIQLFEAGVRLSKDCKQQLATAEGRIRVLLEPQRSGRIRTEDLAIEDEEESGGA